MSLKYLVPKNLQSANTSIKLFNLTVIIISVLSVKCFAVQDSILAKVGSANITTEEFKQRFELVPQVITSTKKNLDGKKNDLLGSLIAEKLWALEAEHFGLDTTDYMKTTYKTIEKMFVRDALFKTEILERAYVTDADLAAGLNRIIYNLNLETAYFIDSSSAFQFYKLLETGISFDSARIIKNPNTYLVQFKYGELEESIEDQLYNLKKVDYTLPVKSGSGWLIFRLVNKELNPLSSQDETIREVKKIIEQRKTEKYYEEFYKKFFTGKKIETEANLFWSIARKLSEILTEKKLQNKISDTAKVYIDINDLVKMELEFGKDTLNMTFVKLEKDPVAVKQFLAEFVFEEFYSSETNMPVISAKLNSRVKYFIEHELLAREGYKRGLHNLSDVKTSISMWRSNSLANIFKDKLLDSINISEQELEDYYNDKNFMLDTSFVEVNILEILTDSLEVVESVIKQLEQGADFRRLASIHTKRIWTKHNGGEFGYFPSVMYGDIGKIAAQMNIGEIYGPLKTPDGYSIFKLLDKIKPERDTTIKFEKVKEDIRKNLTIKKLKDYTVQLANKYGVEVDEQMFSNLHLEDLDMYVFRYMGFGGRMTAVPITLPFSEWFEQWKESKRLAP